MNKIISILLFAVLVPAGSFSGQPPPQCAPMAAQKMQLKDSGFDQQMHCKHTCCMPDKDDAEGVRFIVPSRDHQSLVMHVSLVFAMELPLFEYEKPVVAHSSLRPKAFSPPRLTPLRV